MRFVVRFFVATIVILASSALAVGNSKTLFVPDYLHSEGSVAPHTLDHEALASAMSLSFQTASVQSRIFHVIVGFNTYDLILGDGVKNTNGTTSFFVQVDGASRPSGLATDGSSVAGVLHFPDGSHLNVRTQGGDVFLTADKPLKCGTEPVLAPIGHNGHTNTLDNLADVEQEPHVLGTSRSNLPVFPDPIEVIPVRFRFQTDIDILYVCDTTSRSWVAMDTTQPMTRPERLVFLQAAVDQINRTIANSKPNHAYHVNLVAVVDVDYTSQGHLEDDVNWAHSSAEVATLRDQYHADVVGFWVGSSHPDYGGLSFPFNGNAADAFCVMHISMGGVTATHEFGHTAFEMNHQPSVPYTPDVPNRGYALDGHFSDAMSYPIPPYCLNGCPTQEFYSNPNVSFEGLPAGTSDQNNASMIDVTGPIVARYR